MKAVTKFLRRTLSKENNSADNNNVTTAAPTSSTVTAGNTTDAVTADEISHPGTPGTPGTPTVPEGKLLIAPSPDVTTMIRAPGTLKLDTSNLSPFMDILEDAVKQKIRSPKNALILVDNRHTSQLTTNFASGSLNRSLWETHNTNTLWSSLMQIIQMSEPILSDVTCVTLRSATPQVVSQIATVLPEHHRKLLGALFSASEMIARVDTSSAAVVASSLSQALVWNTSPKSAHTRNAFSNLIGNQRVDFPYALIFARNIGLNVEPMKAKEWHVIMSSYGDPPMTSEEILVPSDRVELLEERPLATDGSAQKMTTKTPSHSSFNEIKPEPVLDVPHRKPSLQSNVTRAVYSKRDDEEPKLEDDEDSFDEELIDRSRPKPTAHQAGRDKNTTIQVKLHEIQELFTMSLVTASSIEFRSFKNFDHDEDYADLT